MKNPDDEFISQKVIITGTEYDAMRWLVLNTNISLSAILLTLHQHIIKRSFPERNYLQLVRVDGRERVIDEFDVTRVLGMIANSIPLSVHSEKKLSHDMIFNVYIAYCNARLHQHVPYEVIRKDYKNQKNEDINTYIAGLFNYVALEHEERIYDQSDNLKTNFKIQKKKYAKTEKAINLYCVLYKNSLEIEMTCKQSIYENNKTQLNLNTLVKKELMIALS
jgi:hypothetical protein